MVVVVDGTVVVSVVVLSVVGIVVGDDVVSISRKAMKTYIKTSLINIRTRSPPILF